MNPRVALRIFISNLLLQVVFSNGNTPSTVGARLMDNDERMRRTPHWWQKIFVHPGGAIKRQKAPSRLSRLFPIQKVMTLDAEQLLNSAHEGMEREDSDIFVRESGVPLESLPRNIAVIADGNRRYGEKYFGGGVLGLIRGYILGSQMGIEFAKWCIAEQIEHFSMYVFSSENWSRPFWDVWGCMFVLKAYGEYVRRFALRHNVRVRVITSTIKEIPQSLLGIMQRLEEDTKHCTGLNFNLLFSYGGQGDILNACRDVARDCIQGRISVDDIDQKAIVNRLATRGEIPDADIVLRTSGVKRTSNFLVWQSHKAQLIFLDMLWPEITKQDLIEVLRTYAKRKGRLVPGDR